MRYRYKATRPKRSQLGGWSASEFKTLLRRLGHRIDRDFYKSGCSISRRGSRLYRWRWWNESFVVDISEPRSGFDRWANSVDRSVSAVDFLRN